MKRLNIKLALWLVGITLVLVVGVHFLHGYQLGRNANFLRLQAEKAREAGKSEEAIKQYNQYLKYRPDPEAYSALAALVYTSAQDAEAPRQHKIRAYNILEEAIRRYPDLFDVRRRLIEYTMQIRRFPDALEHIQYLNDKGVKDPKLNLQKAQCYLGTGEEEKAIKVLYELVGFDEQTEQFNGDPGPGAKEVKAFELLAQILRRKPDGAKRADEVMKQLVVLNPDSSAARLARASYASVVSGPKDVKEDLDRAFELAPQDADVMLAVAAYAMNEKDYEKAQKLLDDALKSHPKRQDAYIRRAQLAIARNNFKEGMEYLQRGVEKATDVQSILPMLLEFQFQVNDLGAARATCKAMEDRGVFRPEFTRYMRARIRFAEGDFWEASRELESVRPALARSVYAGTYLQQLDLLLANCYENLGLFDRQFDVARRILQSQPGDAGARLNEAFALQSLGRYDEATTGLELLRANVEQYPALRTPVLQLLMVDQIRRPKEQRDWTEVERLTAEVYQDSSRTEVDNALLKAELLMAQDRLDEAQRPLMDARKQAPKDIRVWTTLVKLLLLSNKPERVGPLLDMAEKEVGEAFPLRVERVRAIARQGGDTAAAELAMIEQDVEKLPESERVSLMLQLGSAHLQLRDYDGSKRCWKYVVAHDEKNAQIRQVLFELMSDTNDNAGMTEVLTRIRDSRNWGPQSPLYKYCLAMSLLRPLTARAKDKAGPLSDADRKVLTDARRLINEALSVRSEWGVLWRVRAEINQLEGNLDGAISDYQRALECNTTGQTAVARRLVQLLSATRRFAEADKALKYVGELSSADPLNKVIQRWKVEKGDVTEALAMAEKDVQADPKNPANHIWLAYVLEQAGGRSDEAEQAYRKAVEVGPELPQAWQLLVRHLIANKKTAEAVEIIRQATPRLENNPVALAQLHELAQDQQQAEHFYLAALEASPEDLVALRRIVEFYVKSAQTVPSDQTLGQITKASPYLERVVKKTTGASEAASLRELGWARRTQAAILAANGLYDGVVAATRLIEQNARDGKLAEEDLVAIISLLSKRGEPESRVKSIRLLEQLRQVRPGLQPREELLLGQLQERAGNWTAAKDLMVGSLSRQGNDVETLIAFAHSLIKHDETDDAARWLDKVDDLLSKVPPRMMDKFKPAATELRARLLVKMGQPEQAIAVLEQLVPSPLAANQLYRLEEVSRLLEQLGQYDAARKMLDEYVQQEPRGTIALGAFLGRRGEVDKAFALLEESRKNQSIAEILPCALDALRRYPDQATPQRFQVLEDWAKAGLQAEPDAPQIKLLLAELYDLRGQYADVVKMYREVLATKDITPAQAAIVKNNLAFVLAVTKQNVPEALKLIGESIRVMGPSSDLLDTRGIAYLHQGNVKRAVADLRTSASDSPSLSKYFHLAQAEKQANNLDAARDAIAQAEKLGADLTRLTPLEQNSYQQLVDELK